jgi:S-adenosyl-L-methionine hydrolase (adenosine-forming)
MPARRPIVTFTTDFGLSDAYAAAMKAAVLRQCPEAVLVDITHQVSRHDILAGSIALERAIDAFDAGTIHIAVVDPGVGTDRRVLIVEIRRQFVICPDNGLITWAWRRQGPGRAAELLWRPDTFSATFHGRDILAPAAGKMAAGLALATKAITDPMLLPVSPAATLVDACVIHVDHFGNATTNVSQDLLSDGGSVRGVGELRRSYGEVERGQPLALIGSSGLLEIAVREGSAAELLGLKVGDKVIIQ